MEDSVKQRLIKFINFKKLSKNKFEVICGLGSRYVSNISVSIQPDKINRISLNFPDLSTGWLMTGEGEMLKNSSHQASVTESDTITIPKEVWGVIKSQADSLRVRDESLQSKDSQIDELIKLIKQQMEEAKKTNVQKEENAISAVVGL
jgi:hypothetical protein